MKDIQYSPLLEQNQQASFLGLGKKTCEGFPMGQGASGPKVAEVQALLGVAADGNFGPGTAKAAQARLGTPSVSCAQYKQLSGKGITPEKVDTALQVATGVIGLFQKNKNSATPAPPPPPPPPEKDNSTAIIFAVLVGVLLLGGLLFLVVRKK